MRKLYREKLNSWARRAHTNYFGEHLSLNEREDIDGGALDGGAGTSTIVGLTDTPSTYGTTGHVLKVNAAEDGVEWSTQVLLSVATQAQVDAGTNVTHFVCPKTLKEHEQLYTFITPDQKAALDGSLNPLTGINHLIDMVTFTTRIQAMVNNLKNHTTNYELHLGSDQNAALDNANSPSGSNPVATMNDIPSAPPPPDDYAKVNEVNTFTENQHFEKPVYIKGNSIFKTLSGLSLIANVEGDPAQFMYNFNGNGVTGDHDVVNKEFLENRLAAVVPPADDPPHINAVRIETFRHMMEVPGMIVTKTQLEAEFGLLTYDYIVIIVDNDSSKEFMIHYRADNHSWHLVPMIQL